MTTQPSTPGWTESNSAAFLERGRVFTPGREEIEATFLGLIPAPANQNFTVVEVGIGGGWLSEAVLARFPAAHVVGLDGSDTMLKASAERLARFSSRVDLRRFRLEDSAWSSSVGHPQAFVSSLVIHHLDGAGKRALFHQLYAALAEGGALLIADLVAPTSDHERQHLADAWEDEVRRRSLELTGSLDVYDEFIASEWNWYRFPDPIDQPSSLIEQLRWLDEAGFAGVDVFWARAGHAVFGGYKLERP